MEKLGKVMKSCSQYSHSQDQDWGPEPPKHEKGKITTAPLCWILPTYKSCILCDKILYSGFHFHKKILYILVNLWIVSFLQTACFQIVMVCYILMILFLDSIPFTSTFISVMIAVSCRHQQLCYWIACGQFESSSFTLFFKIKIIKYTKGMGM
jgi:hypothetical protein